MLLMLDATELRRRIRMLGRRVVDSRRGRHVALVRLGKRLSDCTDCRVRCEGAWLRRSK